MVRLHNYGLFLCLLVSLMFFCLMIGIVTPALAAGEPVNLEISLKEAILMALRHSDSVKKAEKEIEKKEEWRNYLADQVDYVPLAPPGSALVEVPWVKFLSADLEWRMSKRGLTAQEDAVVMDTCNKYWTILRAQKKLSAAEAALDTALLQLQSARASYQVGMQANIDLIRAEMQYQIVQSAFVTAQNDVNNAYIAFNQLVGLCPGDRPTLTDTVEYQPLEITDLEHEVARVLENAPDVWQAQEMVTMQKYLEDMMFYSGQYQPYQVRKIEVEQAELDAARTKKILEQTTRLLYYNIKNMEERYNEVKEGVKFAKENLRIKKLMFDVGMTTAAEVAAAEKALIDAESQAFELACMHTYMKLAFQKPWAAKADSIMTTGS